MEVSNSNLDRINGYHYAHRFLNEGIIQESIRLAKKKLVKVNEYPVLCTGNLYPNDDRHMI